MSMYTFKTALESIEPLLAQVDEDCQVVICRALIRIGHGRDETAIASMEQYCNRLKEEITPLVESDWFTQRQRTRMWKDLAHFLRAVEFVEMTLPTNELQRQQRIIDTAGDFDLFWTEYPRKQNKSEARRLFMKLKPPPQGFAAILAGLSRAKVSREWADAQYIPHAARFLRHRRWEDSYTPAGSQVLNKHGQAAAEVAKRWAR